MKLITIPLRDFALPVPRSGSIEAHSGYGRSAAEGQEIHARLQKSRRNSDPAYQSEVAVSRQFEREGYCFRIDGRMDGLFRHDPPRIEEIKSAFNIAELARRLADNPLDHPYCLQLLSYGYFFWLEQQLLPRLSFHLVSLRNRDSLDLELELDPARYEGWLELRLCELVLEASRAEKRAARRRKIAGKFPFPFPSPRPGQMELMQEIELGMAAGEPMLIQAPTGLGKTVGVLHPLLKEALGRGQNLVYITPKNSQHPLAEEAVALFRESGSRLGSLSITAKHKICFKDEPLCNPDYCEYARDYYARLGRHRIPELLARKRRLKAATFRDLGREFQLCPFELQLEAVALADVVICDYNYVFAPRSPLGRVTGLAVDQTGLPNLVIDEAHNLPARAMECYSPQLSSLLLEMLREGIRALAPRFRSEALELLDGCIRVIASCRSGAASRPVRIDPPVERFLEQDARLRGFLSRYLDSDAEIRHQDPILRLCSNWSAFCETLIQAADPERQEFFSTYHPHPGGGTIRITCCDASAMLRDCYSGYGQVVAFSATLKPFEYYARLSGLESGSLRKAEFQSPFPRERRKLLIIPQISTRYSQRERNYARIADVIQRISGLRRGNYLVFFPSFEFLERVAALLQPPAGFTLLQQERGMKAAGVEAVLDHLRQGESPTIVLAVQGGSFSEGIDYAGEMLIGAFVVGPPLPVFDLEREQMRAYYQARYAAGFEYAYTIPAMAKAIQSAGRVIRSERDRGLIVLMDGRFLQPDYSATMPSDWFEHDVGELVSGSILAEIAAFWDE